MDKKTKKKRGGQPVENPASERLPTVRVTPDALKKYKETAKRQRKSFSEWVRAVLDKAADK